MKTRLQDILQITTKVTFIKESRILKKRRYPELVNARKLFCLAALNSDHSIMEVSRFLEMAHSSIVSLHYSAKLEYKINSDFIRMYDRMNMIINNQIPVRA